VKIQNVTDASFRKYGKVLEGYDFSALLKEMKHTPVPLCLEYIRIKGTFRQFSCLIYSVFLTFFIYLFSHLTWKYPISFLKFPGTTPAAAKSII